MSEVSQSCLTFCDPMDCSLPGPSGKIHGIFQAIVLEWIAISFSRGSSQPRDRTQVSRIVDRGFTVWAKGNVKYIVIPCSDFSIVDSLLQFFRKIFRNVRVTLSSCKEHELYFSQIVTEDWLSECCRSTT